MNITYEYLLEPLNDDGSAFIVRKMVGWEIDQEYTVEISNKGYLKCNCPGFMGHKHCKHLKMRPSQFMIDVCNEVEEIMHTRTKRVRGEKLTHDRM